MGKSSIKMILTAFIAAFILAVLPAAGASASDTFTPKYSDEELNKIADELVEKYMSDGTDFPAVTAVGVGGALINGEVTGFGESGLEKRVVVSVRYRYYEEYRKMFEDKYGDAVYVEYTPGSKDEYESQSLVIDDADGDAGSEGSGTDPSRNNASAAEHGTGTSDKTQIIAGIILAVIAAVAIYFYVRKNKKPAKKGKKK